MNRVLVGVLGYGERPPPLHDLLSLCAEPTTRAILVTWQCPGPATAAALDRLAHGSPKVQVETSPDNLGSAGGYARLVARASGRDDWDCLLLLDDDLDVAPGTLSALAAAAGTDADAARAPTIFLAYRPRLAELFALVERRLPLRDIRPGACVGFHALNWTRADVRHSSQRRGDAITLDAAPYGGLFIPRAVLPRLGIPNTRLFLYADDAEWTLRFTRGGGRIRLVPDAVLTDRSPSWNATNSLAGNLARRVLHLDDTKAYYEARNRNFLARTQFPGRAAVYRANKFLFLAATYALAAVNMKWSRARLIHRAVADGETMAVTPPDCWPSPPARLDRAGAPPHPV